MAISIKETEFTTLEEVREAMRQLALVEAQIREWAAQADARKAAYLAAEEKRFEELTGPLAQQQAALVSGLFLYCKDHRAEIEKAGRKSIEFPGLGRLKWVYSESLKTAKRKTWKDVVEALKAAGRKDLLRQPEPSVDKEAVAKAKLAADELAKLLMRMEPKKFDEQWGYEIFETALAEAS